MGSVPLVFTSQLPIPGSSLARGRQLRLVLGGALLRRAPLCAVWHRIVYLCHKLRFQVVTRLIPESLAGWLSSPAPPALAPVLLLIWIHSQTS